MIYTYMNFRFQEVKKFPDFTEPDSIQKPATGIYTEPVHNLQPLPDKIYFTLSYALACQVVYVL
jgi:hypothetical protein